MWGAVAAQYLGIVVGRRKPGMVECRWQCLGTEKRKDDEVFKVYRREYKKRFGWIKAGKIEKYAFYAWSKKAREEKTKCDAGGSSLQEFTKWLKES